MSKRPSPQKRLATRHTSEPPFDAAEHFAKYDHSAVHELSSKTVICSATFNRKSTVQACVGATNLHKLGAKMYIHDDGSTEYNEAWLSQFGDRVFRHKHGLGGKRGVASLRSNIVESLLGKFHPEVFQPWLEEDFGKDGPTYLYMVDSDSYHDPHFFYRLHEIVTLRPNFGSICLYNAKFHSPRGGRSEGTAIDRDTVIRGMSAGISMFFRLKSFRDNPTRVQVPDGRGWDGYYSREIANRKVVTSLISYVEHYGKWGFHNKGNFDRDRALCPTSYLSSIRDETIAQIEKSHKAGAKAVAKASAKTVANAAAKAKAAAVTAKAARVAARVAARTDANAKAEANAKAAAVAAKVAAKSARAVARTAAKAKARR